MRSILAAAAFAAAALGAPARADELAEGFNEFKVGLPAELRNMAGRGKLSPVTTADVLVATPTGFRPVSMVKR